MTNEGERKSVKMSDLNLNPGQPKLAEAILPDLVWQKALTALTDPEDILNAGKTCTLFERLLHSKIVPINLGKTLPILMNYLDNKSVLGCRLVSKGWRDVVDNFFENYFLGRTLSEETDGLAPFPVTRETCALYRFRNEHEYFKETMKDHPRNPFIGRAVCFKLDCVYPEKDWLDEEYLNMLDDDSDVFRILYDFFEIFGEHIWTFHLAVYDPLESYNEWGGNYLFTFIMKDIFELAPNLKSFLIEAIDIDLPITMNRNEISWLDPPPALEKLEINSSFSDVKQAIFQRLCNTQLRALYTDSIKEGLQRFMTWSNLREFHAESDLDFDALALNLIAPQLELLALNIKEKYFFRTVSRADAFKTLLTALQNLVTFSPNLKTLRFYSTLIWENESDAVLELPEDLQCPGNIKTLEIQEKTDYTNRNVTDYSFLKSFPNIENIHITQPRLTQRAEMFAKRLTSEMLEEASANETVEVNKFMYDGRMYESNIWNVLPSLKVFSFGEKVYTRLV